MGQPGLGREGATSLRSGEDWGHSRQALHIHSTPKLRRRRKEHRAFQAEGAVHAKAPSEHVRKAAQVGGLNSGVGGGDEIG